MNFFKFRDIFEQYRQLSYENYTKTISKLNPDQKEIKSSKNVKNSNQLYYSLKKIRITLKQIRLLQQNTSALVIGLTPSRIELTDKNISRVFLKTILQTNSKYGQNPFDLRNELIILVTTDFSNNLYKSKKLNDEKIVVIDWFFLLLYIILSPFFFFNLLFKFFKFGIAKKKCSFSLIFSFLAYKSLSKAFCSFEHFNSILINSNSYLLEILRFISLENKKCIKLHEVLHYTPTSTTEASYYYNELNKLSSHKKFKIIPQNKFEHFGYFNVENLENFEINTNFNKIFALNTQLKEQNVLVDFIKNEINPEEGQFIVGFIGGNSHEREFINSSGFKLEVQMIEVIIKTLDHLNINYKVVYYKHPRAYLVYNDFIKLFLSKNIIFNNNFLLCYLSSDFVTGLLSGGIFELAFYDLNAFVSFGSENEDIPSNFFKKVYHPEPEQDPLLALEQAINTIMIKHQSLDLSTKVKSRYENL